MDNIAALVAEAREQPLPSFIPRSEIIRELAEPARFNLVEIITGMRRSGKTFYLYQKMSQLLEAGVPRDRLFYFDAEKPFPAIAAGETVRVVHHELDVSDVVRV